MVSAAASAHSSVVVALRREHSSHLVLVLAFAMAFADYSRNGGVKAVHTDLEAGSACKIGSGPGMLEMVLARNADAARAALQVGRD